MENTYRIWKLGAPAFGLNDALAAFHRPPQKYLVNSEKSLAKETSGLRYRLLIRGFILSSGRMEAPWGAIATHIDEILGRCAPDMMSKTRNFSEMRFGRQKVHEKSFVHAVMESTQEKSSR